MFDKLSSTQLFSGLSAQEIQTLFADTQYDIKQFSHGDIALLKGSGYNSVMIIFEGCFVCEFPHSGGQLSRVDVIESPSIVMPALLYSSDSKVPLNVIADGVVDAIVMDRVEFSGLLSRSLVAMENYLSIVSDRNRPLSERMMYSGFKNIKSKFANLLLEQSRAEKSETIRLRYTQREMAQMFGVTRPALARAIGEIASEGAMLVDHKNITILYPEKLKQYASKK